MGVDEAGRNQFVARINLTINSTRKMFADKRNAIAFVNQVGVTP
jgi:hypothetical protein